MKFRFFIFFSFIILIAGGIPASAQADSVITQITSSARESHAGSISGDGRFVVFESTGDVATVNPRNADGNTEIFLWDAAQRRIFQITDTKPVQKNTFGNFAQTNIKVDIVNRRPVISQNGRWIAFASNATAATVAVPDASNPGSFNGNDYNTQAAPPCTVPSPSPSPSPTATPTATPSSSPTPTPSPTSTPFNNPLQCDANMEVWLYEIPAYDPADLNSGADIPLTDLGLGTFSPVTNSVPSRLPLEGTTTRQPLVADDNHDVSINDDGRAIAFVSTRDLVPGGNSFPTEDNDEIFTFVQGGIATGAEVQMMETVSRGSSKRSSRKTETANSYTGWPPTALSATATGVISQITRTLRGTMANPIYSKNPVISGDGTRVAFASTGDNPILGMTGGNNPLASRNEEVFISDLDANGAPTGIRRQVTVTTPVNGNPVNLWEYGKRLSRNGRYIAFDSFADLANEHGGANQAGFATFIYDVDTSSFRRVLARSNADTAATGGDVPRYPVFTDYDPTGDPATLVLETRMNILPSGTVATTASEGLNPDTGRPVQIYTYPLDVAPSSATFTRITKFPISTQFLAQTRPLTSDTSQRLAFSLSLTELGGGNADLLSEVYYLFIPDVTSTRTDTLEFATGASALPIIPTTGTTPPPVPSPSPSPSPTPVTPAAVQGASPGMLAILSIDGDFGPAITPLTATGSVPGNAPHLPIELSGVSMTIGGHSVGMKSVDSTRIVFTVPQGLGSALTGTSYPVVVNNQGVQTKGFITIVPARPDIFTSTNGPGGIAVAFNVTNAHTNRAIETGPFAVTTVVKRRATEDTATRIRLHLTGVHLVPSTAISIRIGTTTITGTKVLTGGVLFEPGVYTVDFELPSTLQGAGALPIIVTVTSGSTTFTSRLDDTAPVINIL